MSEQVSTTQPLTFRELGYLSEKEYADLRGVKISTIRTERAVGKGPPYTKVGRDIVYPLVQLRTYLAASTQTPPKTATLLNGNKKARIAR